MWEEFDISAQLRRPANNQTDLRIEAKPSRSQPTQACRIRQLWYCPWEGSKSAVSSLFQQLTRYKDIENKSAWISAKIHRLMRDHDIAG
jgi:hypothetical protein